MTSTSVQRALVCYDVLQLVFKQFSVRPDDSVHDWDEDSSRGSLRRRTLASAARVCKALAGPALDVLWESLDDLLPVFRLFSSFIVIEGVTYSVPGLPLPPGPKPQYAWTGPISDQDWERFQLYAVRVRKLTFASGCTIASQAMPALEQIIAFANCRPLFPGLLHLDWTQYLPADGVVVALFSPSLRQLDLKFGSTLSPEDYLLLWQNKEEESAGILLAACQTAPHLEHLSMGPMLRPAALSILLSSKGMKTLDIDLYTIDDALLHTLSSMEKLAQLKVSCTLQVQGGLQPCTFFQLDTLSLEGPVATLHTLALNMTLPTLHSLTVYCVQSSIGADLAPLEETLRATLSHISSHNPWLRHLVVKVGRSESDTSVIVLGPFFRSLSSLKSLRTFQWISVNYLRWEDGDFVEAARAWPEMEELQIHSFIQHLPISPQVLVEVAKSCPNLKLLGLPMVDFDSKSIPPLDSVRVSHGLRTLNIDNNPDCAVDEPFLAAQFLDSLFPQLEIPHTSSARRLWIMREREFGWDDVIDALEDLREQKQFKEDVGRGRTGELQARGMGRCRSQ